MKYERSAGFWIKMLLASAVYVLIITAGLAVLVDPGWFILPYAYLITAFSLVFLYLGFRAFPRVVFSIEVLPNKIVLSHPFFKTEITNVTELQLTASMYRRLIIKDKQNKAGVGSVFNFVKSENMLREMQKTTGVTVRGWDGKPYFKNDLS